MQERPRACPERDVGHAAAFRKKEQVARFVALSIRSHRNLAALAELLIAVARQRDAARAEQRLHEAGAIDAPLGAPAPEVGRAGIPLLGQLGEREMARLDAQLLLAPDAARGNGTPLAVRELHHAAAQRDAPPGRQPAPSIRCDDVGTEITGGVALL